MVRRFLLILVPFLLTPRVSGQEASGVLRGVEGVNPSVELHLPEDRGQDLEKRLQWVLELRLRMSGLRVLPSLQSNSLEMALNATQRGDDYLITYSIGLREPAYLARNVSGESFGEASWVISWQRVGLATMGSGRLAFDLEALVQSLADEFSRSWMEANGSSFGPPGR